MSQTYNYNRKKNTITNFWRRINFVCGEDYCAEPLQPLMVNERAYYTCENHNLRVPVYEIENAVNRMSDEIVSEAEDGCVVNLTNYGWSQRDKATNRVFVFNVLAHTNKKIVVSVREER